MLGFILTPIGLILMFAYIKNGSALLFGIGLAVFMWGIETIIENKTDKLKREILDEIEENK